MNDKILIGLNKTNRPTLLEKLKDRGYTRVALATTPLAPLLVPYETLLEFVPVATKPAKDSLVLSRDMELVWVLKADSERVIGLTSLDKPEPVCIRREDLIAEVAAYKLNGVAHRPGAIKHKLRCRKYLPAGVAISGSKALETE